MSLNQSEDVLDINASNPDTKLIFAYPNLKSLVRLFFVLIFYMIITGTGVAHSAWYYAGTPY